MMEVSFAHDRYWKRVRAGGALREASHLPLVEPSLG